MQRVWGFLVIMLWLSIIGDATNLGATLKRAKRHRQLGEGATIIKQHRRPPFKPGPWNHAHATFYEGGSGTFGMDKKDIFNLKSTVTHQSINNTGS